MRAAYFAGSDDIERVEQMTILITGGACQGKRAYAEEKFSLTPEEILPADSEQITEGIRCVDALHLRVKTLIETESNREEALDRLFAFCKDKIVICDDIFCGIVPLEPAMREWREYTGRLLCRIAKQADCVIRMQCGLAQKIKGDL